MKPEGLPKYPVSAGKPLSDAVIAVGVNRRRFTWMALASGALCIGFIVFAPMIIIEPALVKGFVMGIPAGLLGSSIGLLTFRSTMFTYDRTAGTVEARDRLWGRLRTYPRRERGYERLEYSIHFARLYEVRPDGHRHEIFVRAWAANRREWAAFVDRLLEDRARVEQAAATTEPIPVAPRAEDRSET